MNLLSIDAVIIGKAQSSHCGMDGQWDNVSFPFLFPFDAGAKTNVTLYTVAILILASLDS